MHNGTTITRFIIEAQRKAGAATCDIDDKIRNSGTEGELRLMSEANPVRFVVEQTGGMSSTGRERIMDIKPWKLHQRVPVILGSREEVKRVVSYHAE